MANPEHLTLLLTGAAFARSLREDTAALTFDLSGVDLSYYVLSGARLDGANLRDAVLSKVVMQDASLRGADLRNVDFRNADLRRSNLCDADLRNANLRNADLSHTDLRGAKLDGANLDGANLEGTSFDRASPDGANPDVADPDGPDLDVAGPDVAGPDFANPDVAEADVAVPDGADPDVGNVDNARFAAESRSAANTQGPHFTAEGLRRDPSKETIPAAPSDRVRKEPVITAQIDGLRLHMSHPSHTEFAYANRTTGVVVALKGIDPDMEPGTGDQQENGSGTETMEPQSDGNEEVSDQPVPADSGSVTISPEQQRSNDLSCEEARAVPQENGAEEADTRDCDLAPAPDEIETVPLSGDVATEIDRLLSFIDSRRPFRLRVVPGSASADRITDVLTSLDQLHRAAGGSGLQFAAKGFTVRAVGNDEVANR